MHDGEITEWVAGHQHQLLRSAYLLTGDLQRAEDLVQEALIKVALHWTRLRAGNPGAFARTILVRDNISAWRRRRREHPVDAVRETGVSPPESEVSLVVRQALSRLTAKQRAVVVLRHFDDLSEAETARILGVGVGTVKSQNAAALARLRDGAPELLELRGRS